MTRLGIRLATVGGWGAAAGLGLTATAVAVGTAILLFALAFLPAVADRDARTAWRDYLVEGAGGTLVLIQEDRHEGRALTRVHVARAGSGEPVLPPELAGLPGTGTAYVSPALRAAIADTPPDRLGDRFGQIIGTIPDGLLASPDDLVAVVGTDPAVLRDLGALEVSAFATTAAPLDLPPIAALITILAAVGALAPVAVFVATATRMSAARRELRLAALRLVGATPAQIAWLAVVEAITATVIGAIGGVALFVAARPLVAQVPLDDATWWPHSISPPLPAAVALLLVVQLVGAGAALTAIRRLNISPLGLQRRAAAPPPRLRRVVPLAFALAALLAAVAWYRSDGGTVALGGVGVAFGGVVMGIALVGPWLTGMVGLGVHRAGRGAAAVLAGRRLQDDPRGSFGAIAGVIMAVFVASAFFTFVGYARGEARETQDPLLREGRVVAYVGSASTSTGGIDDRVATLAGVRSAVAVREASLRTADGIESYGWVADCPRLIATLGLAAVTCSPEGVTVINVGVTPGTYRLSSTIGGEPAAPPGFTVTIGEGAPLLESGGELMGYLPPVVVDPAALGGPGAVAALPITRIYAATDGGELVVERILTAIVQTLPTASVQGAGDVVAGSETYAEIGRIVSLGLIGTLALAGCSLAVAVMTATLDRRRQFVFLRSTGMPVSGLHATILLQAAAPLIVVAAFSGLLGVVVGMVVLSVAGAPVVAFPDPALLLTLALSLAVAMGIVALTLPPLERLTRPAAVRHE